MLGVALTAQRAGWGGGPVIINISSQSAVSYECYQTPAFSLNLGMTTWDDNEVDLTGYTSLPGYQNGKYTLAFNWRPNYSDLDYASGTYLGNIGRFHVVDVTQLAGPGFAVYCSAGISYNTPKELQITYGIDNEGLGGAAFTVEFPGAYADWMGGWYMVVVSVSPNVGDFTSWSAPGFASGDRYVRIAIYDQETGELIVKKDERWNAITEPDVANLANPLLSIDPYDTTTDCFEQRVFNSGSVPILENLISNHWFSYGTMWDPLSIDQATEAWRTTRPSRDIGSARAWVNMQTTEQVTTGTTPNELYWVGLSGRDLYSDPNATNKGFSRFSAQAWQEVNNNNPDQQWSNIESALIPKDRNT